MKITLTWPKPTNNPNPKCNPIQYYTDTDTKPKPTNNP